MIFIIYSRIRRCSIVNARKLYRRVVNVSTCYFRVVPAQAWQKMWAGPCNLPCRDPGHDKTLMFVSCRYGPKYFVLCHAKRPCRMTHPQMARQVPALLRVIEMILPRFKTAIASQHAIFHASSEQNATILFSLPSLCSMFIIVKAMPGLSGTKLANLIYHGIVKL